jgi:NAD(P)-dependent dehydrogenase (short-subunit alcohol dehydrogenase family)
MGRLTRKAALITIGAGGCGCGLAASELFAEGGAKVAIIDLPSSQGKLVAKRINAFAGLDCCFPADASVADQIRRAVRRAKECFEPIAVLLNLAGMTAVGAPLETRGNSLATCSLAPSCGLTRHEDMQ